MTHVAVVYHSADLDGKSVAVIAGAYLKEKYPDAELHYVGWNYDRRLKSDAVLSAYEFAEVIIGDCSCTGADAVDDFNWLAQRSDRIRLFDHHASSSTALGLPEKEGDVPGPRLLTHRIEDVLDTGRCGALITFHELFLGREVPRALRLVDDYDRWVHADPDSRALNAAIFAAGPFYPDSQEGTVCLLQAFLLEADEEADELLDLMIAQGREELDRQRRQNAADCYRYLFRAKLVVGEERIPCLAVILSRPANSDFFVGYDQESLLVTIRREVIRSPEGDKLVWRYGLYCPDGTVHCGELAKKLGGGGHPGAAGFTTTASQLLLEDEQPL